MVLKIPTGNPLEKIKRKISKKDVIPKESSVPISKVNGVLVPFSIGLGVDTSAGAYTISVQASGSGDKLVGFKTTRSIHNQTGAADDYDYKIENITKGTTLTSTTGHTLADTSFTVLSQFWSLDQIAPGDNIKFSITDGIIGTVAARASLGTISFFLESVDEGIIS